MAEESAFELKPIFRYLIPYFTFCAIISTIAFWSTFNINIFEFLDISDIVTVFIYPIFFNSVLLIAPFLFLPGLISTRSRVYHFIILLVIPILQLILIGSMNTLFSAWIMIRALLTLTLIIVILLLLLIRKGSLNRPVRVLEVGTVSLPFLVLAIYLPIASFVLSKFQSISIHANWQYQEIIQCSGCKLDAKYKYIGSAGEFIFITTIDNSKLLLLNKSQVNYIVFKLFQIEVPDGGGMPKNPPPNPPG